VSSDLKAWQNYLLLGQILRDIEQQMCHWNGSWESAKYIDLYFTLFYGGV